MKSKLARILSVLMIAVVAIGLIGAGTNTAYAKQNWTLGGDLESDFVWVDQPYIGTGVYDSNSNNWTEGKLISIKSSNSKVFKVVRHKWSGQYYFDMYAKKPGKVTLTVKFKTPSGTSKTIKKKLEVRKYPDPLKSLKVNGKSINLDDNKYDCHKKSSKTSAKIKAVAADGWKIDYVYGWRYKGDNEYRLKGVTKKKIKNGTAIDFPKKYDEMSVTIGLRKDNENIEYRVWIKR